MNYLKTLVIALLFIPTCAFAAPISWDFTSGILQPLQSAWTALIRGNSFVATSTTATSTFPNLSATSTRFAGSLYDGSNSRGSNGYVLQSTGSGIEWVATNTLGFTGGAGHDAVTLAGALDYITLAGQVITRNAIDLATDITGLLDEGNIDADIARDSELHSAVTLSGALDYITLVGQDIVRGAIDLATDITGTLGASNGGTGLTSTSTILFENEIDTEAELETYLTDVTNVFTNNDGALNDDDLTNNQIDDLSDVAALSETTGDVLSWNGSAWIDVATSTLGILSSSISDFVSTVRTSISETITGIDYSNSTGVFSLTTGYNIPTTASTSAWEGFWQVPSTRITAGNLLSWVGNTLNSTALSTTSIDSLAEIESISGVSNILIENDIDASSELRALMDDETGTGALMFGITSSMSDDLSCTASQVLARNSGDSAWECVAQTGGGGGGGMSTTTDNNPQLNEVISYLTTDFYVGGSASNTAELNFDKDSATLTLSSTTASGGFVGIGTTSQRSALNVEGGAFITGTVTTTAIVATGTATSSIANLSVTGGIALLGEYFTNFTNYVRTLVSETVAGLTYNSGTGVLSLDSGYEIPLTASTTNWNGFYNTPSTRITAGTNLSWSGNTLNASGGGASDFTFLSNFGTNTAATNTPIWAQWGLYASNTSRMSTTTFVGSIGIGSSSPTSALTIRGNPSKLNFFQDGGSFLIKGGNFLAPAYGGAGDRFEWIESQSAIRAGEVQGTQWDDVNIGFASAAFNVNTTASGDGATALGLESVAGGDYSLAAIRGTASGANSAAIGYQAISSGNSSFALGFDANAAGAASVAIGEGTYARDDSRAFGQYASSSESTMVFGFGVNGLAPIENTTLGSIAFGMFSTIPTLTIKGADTLGANTIGGVGIGTTSPTALLSLHVTQGLSSTTDIFRIASSTGSATSTIFSIARTGTTTSSNGFNITGGCYAVSGICLTTGGGITSLGGQTGATQTFASSTPASGGWGITSGTNTHTLTIPAAGVGSPYGLLSSTDWSTFNSKQSTLTAGAYVTINGTTINATGISTTSIDTSSELASILTDETGTAGSLVFSADPTFTGIARFANASGTNFSSGYLAIGQSATTTISTAGEITTPALTLSGAATGCATFTTGVLSSTGVACGSGGGGGGVSTTTDNNATPGEIVSYVTTDFYIGGSASNTAEFNFDKDSATLTLSSTTASGGFIGIGTTTQRSALNVEGSAFFTGNATATNITATGTLWINAVRDSTQSLGTNGMVLQTSGSLASWVSTSSLNISQWVTSGTSIHYPNGNVGIGSSTPSAVLAVASSTPSYNYPLFSVSTSSAQEAFADLFEIFATTTTANLASSLSTMLQDIGVRVSVGLQSYFKWGITDHFMVRGRMRQADWATVNCPNPAGTAQIIADGLTACQGFSFMEDSTGFLNASSSNGYNFASMYAVAANDGAGVFVNSTSTGWITFATSTPVIEATARINGAAHATTTRFYIGFFNTNIQGNAFETAPTGGCYFTASSTQANWVTVCNSSATAATVVSTGISSTTNITSGGQFYRFRIDADAVGTRFRMFDGQTTVYDGTITTNRPASTVNMNAGIYLARTVAFALPQFDFRDIYFDYRTFLPGN